MTNHLDNHPPPTAANQQAMPPAREGMPGERQLVARVWQTWARGILPRQRRDGSTDDGAFHEYDHGWHDGRYTALLVPRLIATRLWANEIDADHLALEEAARRGLQFVLRRQRADGMLDLGGAYSANEAGFPIPALVEAWRRLAELASPWAEQMRALIATFVRRAGEAVLCGEALTANHRWAAAAAPLAAAGQIRPDDRYLAKIDAYLADGIDCDQDGCWHEERGVGYNNVANHGMLVLADCLERPEFIAHVVRNLRFMLYNTQPDGSGETMYSFRQDRGSLGHRPCDYRIARRAAIEADDGELATLAQLDGIRPPGAGCLMPLLFDLDRFPGPPPAPRAIPERYEKHFRGIQVIRRREGHTAMTLAADSGNHFFDRVRDQFGGSRRSEDWFKLVHGGITIASLQLAVAQGRCLQPATLEPVAENLYHLAGASSGWLHTLHFRPGWPQVKVGRDLAYELQVAWRVGGLRIHLDCRSESMLAAELRLWVSPQTRLLSTSGNCRLTAGQRYNLQGGTIRLRSSNGTIAIAGLPTPAHAMEIDDEPAIPSRLKAECARLAIGLRLPVQLELEFNLE